MSEGKDSWQWVDEDPISAILSSVRPAKRTGPLDDVPAQALALQAGDITKETIAQLDQFTEAGAAQLDPGRFGEATESYRRAFEANPDATGDYDHAAGHYNRAVAMALLEQWEAA